MQLPHAGTFDAVLEHALIAMAGFSEPCEDASMSPQKDREIG